MSPEHDISIQDGKGFIAAKQRLKASEVSRRTQEEGGKQTGNVEPKKEKH